MNTKQIYTDNNINVYKVKYPSDIVELCKNIKNDLTLPHFNNSYYSYRFVNGITYTLYIVKYKDDTAPIIIHIPSNDNGNYGITLSSGKTIYQTKDELLSSYPVINKCIDKLTPEQLTKNELYIINLRNTFPEAKIPSENDYVNALLKTREGCEIIVNSYASLSDPIFNSIYSDMDDKELTPGKSLIYRYIELGGTRLTENQIEKVKNKINKEEFKKFRIKYITNICRIYKITLQVIDKENSILSATHEYTEDDSKTYIDYRDIKYSGLNIFVLNCNFRIKYSDLMGDLTSLQLNRFTINKDLVIHCPEITSLKGCPESIGGSFDCSKSPNIASFEYCPKHIGGDFDCRGNKVAQYLTGVPKVIYGIFNCSRMPRLITLEGGPDKVEGDFKCFRCKLLKNLKGSPKVVEGYYSCSNCENLVTLSGAPHRILKNFYCEDCPHLRSMMGIVNSKIDGFIFKPDHLKQKSGTFHPFSTFDQFHSSDK